MADPINAAAKVAATDELTPLLGAPDTAGGKAVASEPGTSANGNHDSTQGAGTEVDKPMPYTQVVLLCFASIIEPVSYFAIFPIISDMLVHTGGLGYESISLWSGLIEAIFSVVQMTVMITYGKLADRIGRKPILVFSLFGIAGASALFGLSQSLWQMVLFRAITGLFAGSSVTIRAMLSEITTKKTQARAFSWYMFARNLGIFVGPLIGGSLADPRKNIPIFQHNGFFKQFPYSLSMFVTAAVCVVAAVVTLTSVKETLQSKTKSGQAEAETSMSIREILRSPGVGVVLYLYGHVGFLALTYTAVNPIWSYEPIDLGGIDLSPRYISIFVALAGASQALWMLGPFPPLQQRYGTGPVLRACTTVWPIFILVMPLMNELRRFGWDTAFWIGFTILTVMGSGVAMSFACVQLCLNDIAPSPSTLGTLNAIALTINSGIRAVAPVLGTAIYEAGIKLRWIDGHLIWVVLVAVALVLAFGARFLPPQAEGKPQKKVVHEES